MKKCFDLLLELVRAAMGSERIDFDKLKSATPDEWRQMIDLAYNQGVDVMIADGYQRLVDIRPDFETALDGEELSELRYELFGGVLQAENEYECHRMAILDLANFYRKQGIDMMLLKGCGLSFYWPVPNHRLVGDIDVWLFGRQKEADVILENKRGVKIDKSHHHHTVFRYKGQVVENHFDIIYTRNKLSNIGFEKYLNRMASLDSCLESKDLPGVYLPNPDFNALFLLKHIANHFAPVDMNLRQLLDWLFFLQKNNDRIDWPKVETEFHKSRLDKFAGVLNAIGVEYLGMDKTLFRHLESDSALVKRVLFEILEPEFKEKEDGTLISNLKVKPRRWWHSRWKHQLCFPDSLLSSFLFGLWGKILKPSHFVE